MSKSTGMSKLEQIASRLEGHSAHSDITGVKVFETKPKVISTGLNALTSEQAGDNEKEVVQNNEGNNNETDKGHQVVQSTSNNPSPVVESTNEVVNSSQQEIIVHKRRANRSIFIQDEEKVNDTKGMSFQVDLELIPIIKKYTKWGKGYKTINLMLIATLLDNEEVVKDLIENDIVTYNTLIRLEEKYQKKLEEY